MRFIDDIHLADPVSQNNASVPDAFLAKERVGYRETTAAHFSWMFFWVYQS